MKDDDAFGGQVPEMDPGFLSLLFFLFFSLSLSPPPSTPRWHLNETWCHVNGHKMAFPEEREAEVSKKRNGMLADIGKVGKSPTVGGMRMKWTRVTHTVKGYSLIY